MPAVMPILATRGIPKECPSNDHTEAVLLIMELAKAVSDMTTPTPRWKDRARHVIARRVAVRNLYEALTKQQINPGMLDAILEEMP